MAKTVIITGAASGMGFLSAKCFAKQGDNVVLTDVNEDALQKCVDQIIADGGNAIGTVCDVRDYTQVCAACALANEKFGSIDVVINLAGGAECRMLNCFNKEFPDVPIEVYDWGIDVNLKGPFYFAHAVLKQMRKQNSGLIINIGSITGAEGSDYGMDYPTSKAAWSIPGWGPESAPAALYNHPPLFQ